MRHIFVSWNIFFWLSNVLIAQFVCAQQRDNLLYSQCQSEKPLKLIE